MDLNIDEIISEEEMKIKNLDYLDKENWNFEYKEGFNFGSISEYAKTWVGMANNFGGLIFHGVDNLGNILGLTSKDLELFQNIDRSRISAHFRDFLSNEVDWKQKLIEVNAEYIGIIQIEEANITSKPIVVTKDYGHSDPSKRMLEGEIYYRYDERTTRIKRTELMEIFELKKQMEFKSFIEKLDIILKAGAENVAILDLLSGDLDVGRGSQIKVQVDSETLDEITDRIEFVKEGSFIETGGDPALILKGSIEPVETIEVEKPIHIPLNLQGYVSSFTNLDIIENIDPQEYVIWLTRSKESAFLPIFYFIHNSEMEYDKFIPLINELDGVRNEHTREIILDRLEHNNNRIKKMKTLRPHDTKYKYDRKRALKTLKDGSISNGVHELIKMQTATKEEQKASNHKIRMKMDAIEMISNDEAKKYKNDIFELFALISKDIGTITTKVQSYLRSAMDYIDHELFCSRCENAV